MALSVTLALAGLSLIHGEARPPFATAQQPFSGPSQNPWFSAGITVVRADVDGDGRDEALLTGVQGRLVVMRFGADGWSLEPTYLQALDTPQHVEPTDLDGDGAPELIVGSQVGLQVHWNDGAGKFALPQPIAKGNCTSVRAGDLDGDGLTDLLACMFGPPWTGFAPDHGTPSGLLAFLGNGQRGFELSAVTYAPSPSDEVALGDFDEDGTLDAAKADILSIAVYLGEGNGRLSFVYGADGGADLGLIASDLDGDGHLDLARLATEAGIQPALFGDGTGQFTEGPALWPQRGITGFPPVPYDLDAGDFDGDGQPDLLLIQDDHPELIRSTAHKGFARSEPLPLPERSWAAGLADVDGDGALDLVAHTPLFQWTAPGQFPPGWISVLHGDGRGGLRGVRSAPRPDHLTGEPVQMASGDLDGDGLPDLVELGGGMTGGASVMLSDEQSGWSAPIAHTGVAAMLYPRVGDVDGDGHADLVGTLGGSNDLVVHRGDGAGGLGRPIVSAVPAGLTAHDYELADLDGDGRSDVVMRETSPRVGALRVHLARGQGYFGPALQHPELDFVASMQPTDVDLDGRSDLLVVQWNWSRGFGRVLVLPGLGDGRFGAEQVLASFESWIPSAAVGDVDGDGLPDIAIGESRGGAVGHEIAVHLATAPGEFGRVVRSRLGTPPKQLALGDLDGDGILDLLAGQSVVDDHLLRGLGNGGFEPWCQLGSLGTLRAIADMDRNGRADLVYEATVVLNRAP
jgi:hypothetical protein